MFKKEDEKEIKIDKKKKIGIYNIDLERNYNLNPDLNLNSVNKEEEKDQNLIN